MARAAAPVLRVVSGGLDRVSTDDVARPAARGRAMIMIAALLAVGLIYINVDSLKSGDSFGKLTQEATQLQRSNTQLAALVAQRGSTERIQSEASKMGLVSPPPAGYTFLNEHQSDPLRAVRGYTTPAAAPPTVTQPAAPPPTTTPQSQIQAPAAGTAPAQTGAGTDTTLTTSPPPAPTSGGGAGSPTGGANPAVGGN